MHMAVKMNMPPLQAKVVVEAVAREAEGTRNQKMITHQLMQVNDTEPIIISRVAMLNKIMP